MKFVKTWNPLFIGISLLVITGCSRLAPSTANDGEFKIVQFSGKTDRIQDIQQPANRGGTVVLKGTIGKQVPLLEGVVYELRDATGTIWVLSRQAAPSQGDEVVIKGKVRYQSIRLHNQDQGSAYVEQEEQLHHTPAIKS